MQKSRSFKKFFRWAELLNREWFIFLFLLLLSATFWFTVTLGEEKNIEISIPILIVDVPDNVVFIDDNPDTINVNIHGSTGDVMQYLLFEKGDTVKIPFHRFNRSSGEISVSNAEFLKLMNHNNNDANIQLVKRDGLVYHFCYVTNYKNLPVRVRGNMGDLSNVEIRVSPDTVRAYAQQQTLDRLTEIFTENINLKDAYKGDSLVIDKRLQSVRGARFEPQYVKVSINPLYYIDKEIEVPITCINKPDHVKVHLFPLKTTVKFQVNMAQYNAVDEEMFEVVFDYNSLEESQKTYPLAITKKPNFVRNVSLVKKSVEALVEK